MGYTQPFLDVRKVGADTKIQGTSLTSTDTTYFYANGTDIYPYVRLIGLGGIVLMLHTNDSLSIADTVAGTILEIAHATPDITFTGLADKNIFLKTQGSGTVKFGSFVGTGDTATNGYITITDAGGTLRRLAVVP